MTKTLNERRSGFPAQAIANLTDPADLDPVPPGFGGIIWTDGIEEVDPVWQHKQSPQDR